MKAGDLVQSNIFAPNGSGGYGLVISLCSVNIPRGYWNVHWAGYESDDGMEANEGGLHHIHESDMVVVSASTKRESIGTAKPAKNKT
jgi:hypothetical protein